jgi:predicted phage terminase large subunit-like protein
MASFEAQGSDIFKEEWIQMSEDEPDTGDWFVSIDMAGFEEAGRKKKTQLDKTAIAIAKVNEDGWWIKDIIYGRWTFDETTRRIFNIVEEYDPVSVGLEAGIAKQAIVSPLIDMMRKKNVYFNIKELSHGNKNKLNRVVSALQGRFEHGAIKLKKGKWNVEFLDQLFQFPNPQVHDDMIDAVAYIDQIAKTSYYQNFNIEENEYELLDATAGY